MAMKTPISPKISLERLRHVAAQQFDIRIASDGRWFHEGDEIRRFELVKLFASILVLDDDGDYWLATPAEKGRITVDDAPFIIRDMTVKTGVRPQQNEICFHSNIDETVLLDIKHPLQLRAGVVPHCFRFGQFCQCRLWWSGSAQQPDHQLCVTQKDCQTASSQQRTTRQPRPRCMKI